MLADVGGECWVCGPTAAALYGLDGLALRRPFHVLLPRTRNVRRAGVAVHTTMVMPPIDRESRGGLPITSPTRTLIDIAGHETPARLTAALDSALRDGLTSEDLLHRRIAALRPRAAMASRACSTSSPATRSRAVATAGWSASTCGCSLPQGCRDRSRRRCSPVRATGSSAWTAASRARPSSSSSSATGSTGSRSRWRATPSGSTPSVLAGHEPYQFTYGQVVTSPDAVIATTRAALVANTASSPVDHTCHP